MDTLIRERNGKEEIWYSEKYLRTQIEQAYKAGIHKGLKIEFHAITPMNGEMVNDLIDVFNKKVIDEYQLAFENNEVWRVQKEWDSSMGTIHDGY